MRLARPAPAVDGAAPAKGRAGARHAATAGPVGADGDGRAWVGRPAAGAGAVPVAGRVAETFAHGDGAEAGPGEGGEHMVDQLVDDQVVDVVLDVQVAVAAWVGAGDGTGEDVLAALDVVIRGVDVALGVEIEVDDVVTEFGEDGLAVTGADGKGRTHVGGEEAEDRVDGNFVPDDLVPELLVAQLAGVLVRPGMAGNLVAIGVHPLGLLLAHPSSSADGREGVTGALLEGWQDKGSTGR
jgi:hypothetical protein